MIYFPHPCGFYKKKGIFSTSYRAPPFDSLSEYNSKPVRLPLVLGKDLPLVLLPCLGCVPTPDTPGAMARSELTVSVMSQCCPRQGIAMWRTSLLLLCGWGRAGGHRL